MNSPYGQQKERKKNREKCIMENSYQPKKKPRLSNEIGTQIKNDVSLIHSQMRK